MLLREQWALASLVPAALGLTLSLPGVSIGVGVSIPGISLPWPTQNCPGGTITKTETKQGTTTVTPAPDVISTVVTVTDVGAPTTATITSTSTLIVNTDVTVTVTGLTPTLSSTTELTCFSTPGIQAEYILLPSTAPAKRGVPPGYLQPPGYSQPPGYPRPPTYSPTKISSIRAVTVTKTTTVTVDGCPKSSRVHSTTSWHRTSSKTTTWHKTWTSSVTTDRTTTRSTTASTCVTHTVTQTRGGTTTLPRATTTSTSTSTSTSTPTVTTTFVTTSTVVSVGATSTVTSIPAASTVLFANVKPTGIPYYYYYPRTYGDENNLWANLPSVVNGLSNSSDYQTSGLIQNVNTLVSDDGSQLNGLPGGATVAGQSFAMIFQGYVWPIFGPGVYSLISRAYVSDDTALAWVGDKALSNNWNYENADYIQEYPGANGATFVNDGVATFTLLANQVIPITFLFGNTDGPGKSDFFIQFEGQNYYDTSPYFVSDCQAFNNFYP